jgi:hypothetical protein
MKTVEGAIFSTCAYDIDNRYIDLTLNPTYDGRAFTLAMYDTSNNWEPNVAIELHLTRVDLRTVVNRLTNILDKRENT